MQKHTVIINKIQKFQKIQKIQKSRTQNLALEAPLLKFHYCVETGGLGTEDWGAGGAGHWGLEPGGWELGSGEWGHNKGTSVAEPQ